MLMNRFPGEGNGNPLQYSCLENPTDRGAWRALVHEVPKNRAANTFNFEWTGHSQNESRYVTEELLFSVLSFSGWMLALSVWTFSGRVEHRQTVLWRTWSPGSAISNALAPASPGLAIDGWVFLFGINRLFLRAVLGLQKNLTEGREFPCTPFLRTPYSNPPSFPQLVSYIGGGISATIEEPMLRHYY